MIKILTVVMVLIGTPVFSSEIVEIAKSQIGRGETMSDNHGKDVRRYTRGQDVAWCAGFVSWVLTEAGRLRDSQYFLSAREYWNMTDKRVKEPRPGDVICFTRGSGWTGHVGIIEKIEGNKIITIEGNVGKFPAKVKRVTYNGHIKNLLGFVRL